ncbi:MAG: hypothetical protein A4E19_21140 [Nitrospira sp. SG-bin1]|nr:MAG: hypothetical protein A4E19_21140 [Nitrospira sp. SG-bin1]
MMSVLTACRHAVLLPAMLIVPTGCVQTTVQEHSSQQEYLGMGIVSGTLGEQQRVALCAGQPSSTSVSGQVQALEGGAYLIRDALDRDIRIPHDENTKIDRPAHVGDRIQAWLDRHGRAVLIRSLDGNGR